MKLSTIITWHLVSTLILIALYIVANFIWPGLDVHRKFSITTAVVFGGLSLLVCGFSARLIHHKNPYYFSWVTMFSVLVKLGIGMALVVAYKRMFPIIDKLFVLSFILAYVIYTVCEVWLLQKIINTSKTSWNNS